ncbi:type IV pilus modification protein PilV [Acinetobacter indicus]|uniref:type IV pilus modification protein PilV n=1 Tax=Acinetobacter indicus TaxID=756892 RepID=UPI001443FFA7|nr:type IV pilus modification protein PilV [Acinetobacter indicus]
MIRNQYGVGLVEVLVALVLLGIAVLGFTALQIRAVSASADAGQNIQAMNIARDLSERIRMNRAGSNDYKESNSVTDCAANFCSSSQMAAYDFEQVQLRAEDLGMSIAVHDCQGSTLKRKCVYVAWGTTTATNGSGGNHCTNGTAYNPNAQCIIMEVYNYD